jgi:8-oxo-dGTP diphosphatase
MNTNTVIEGDRMPAILTFGIKEENIDYKQRVGCYGIIFNKDRTKVGIINIKDRYFLPGGGMEGNENHFECLKREVWEEMGYNIKICEYIGEAQKYFYSQHYSTHYLGIGHFYKCELGEKLGDPIEEDHIFEMLEIQEAMEKLVHDHQCWAIKRALELS